MVLMFLLFSLHNPHSKTKYDENGNWARKGQINAELLTLFLSDNYFQLPHPKSTGREYFHLSWLKRQLTNFTHISNEDVQATLTALTAITIVDAIKQHSPNNEASTKIYLCGGGAHNKILKDTIDKQLALHYKNYKLLLTNQKDIDGDQLEAIAFAWLAFAYDKKLLSSMSTVTGASKCCTLGNEYLP